MKDWTGNNNSIWKTLGASNHTDKERQSEDFYATSSDAIDKLLKVAHPHRQIWECAAGAGHLSERLTYFGYNVYSTDIVERGYPLGAIKDFLAATSADVPFDGEFDILTNPPYKYAKDFVLKSLELLPADSHCYMFLKLTFLEGKARYKEIFAKTPPKAIYVFSERVLCAKNADFNSMRAGGGSAVAYAWYEWQKGYTGDTILSGFEQRNAMAKIVYVDEHGKKNGMLSGAITSEVLFAFVGQDKLLPRATFYLKIGKHKDENGELIDDYVPCVCWRKLAKFVRHFKRGMTVIVTGAFYTSKRKENGAWVEEEQFFCETFMPQVWRYRKIVKDKLEEGDYQKEDDTPYTSRKPDGYDF